MGRIRSNTKYYDCEFSVGEEKDAYDLLDDIMKLGFGTPSISRSTTKHINSKNGRETIYNTWTVSKNGAFAYLLNYLGAFDGKKTEKSRKVPEWIMNGNNRIQREFISGFIAGDGCRLSINLNEERYKISCGRLCQYSSKEFGFKNLFAFGRAIQKQSCFANHTKLFIYFISQRKSKIYY